MILFLQIILMIGGFGLLICGSLYGIFRLYDKLRPNNSVPIFNCTEPKNLSMDLTPPRQDLIKVDTIDIGFPD